MLTNPAKITYMKFDLAADMMARGGTQTKEPSKGKGLLQRFNINKSKDETSSGNEPIDIAMKYFVAIRNERNKLKQNKQDT